MWMRCKLSVNIEKLHLDSKYTQNSALTVIPKCIDDNHEVLELRVISHLAQ